LAQIGHFYVATQAIFEEICQVAEEENDADT